MKRMLLIVVLMILVAIAVAFAGDTDDQVKELIENKCGLCHTADYALGLSDTAEGWRATVVRMREDNGADLTDQEAELIINYLVKHRGR